MNDKKLADVIILARGGGSIEDLWPFNEEVVARAIYESKLPVISAVGHETDFTIADFVADLRAPTPSAAAELAVPDIIELKEKIGKYNNRFSIALIKKVELMKLQYQKVMNLKVFKEPLLRIQEEYLKLDNNIKIMYDRTLEKYKQANFEFKNVIAKLDTLSPLKTLLRGYTIAQKDGIAVKSAKDLSNKDKINLKFIDGEAKAVIEDITIKE